MKHIKKIMALVFAFAMALGMTTTVFADTEYSITVTPSGDNVSIEGNTYKAYKLFDVTYADTNADSEHDAFAYSISTDNYFYKTADAKTKLDKYFTFSDTADSTVKAVTVKDGVTFDTKAAYELAELLNKANVLTAAPVAGSAIGDNQDKAEIKNLPSAGYYIVTGEGHALDGENKTVTAAVALTTTHPTATIKAKVDAPSVDKEVDNPIDTDKHENQKSIGDTVNYTINSKVPDMTGYTQKYFFVVSDTLSKGLTLVDDDKNNDSIPDGFEVKIGTTTLIRVADAAAAKTTPTNTYYIEKGTDTSGNATIKIVFSNFIQYKGTYNAETEVWDNSKEGQAITIKYEAILNDDAVIGNDGNTNTVKVQYSNNPNDEGTGTPDKPDEPSSSDKTGETPDHTTKTYVTGVQLEKVDKDNPSTKLANVTFKLEGTNLNDVKETRYDRFVPLTDDEKENEEFTNKWYLLKDGTYTQDAPITEGDGKNVDSYAETTPGYKKVAEATFNPSFQKEDGDTVVYTGKTDANGIMKFEGLSAGTYTLTELKTLDGYNLLSEPITLTVTAKTKTEGTGSDAKTTFDTWEVKNGETALTENDKTHLFEIQIENGKGTELPSTGGIGTTLFYIIGTLLVLGAGVVLVTRRKMDSE